MVSMVLAAPLANTTIVVWSSGTWPASSAAAVELVGLACCWVALAPELQGPQAMQQMGTQSSRAMGCMHVQLWLTCSHPCAAAVQAWAHAHAHACRAPLSDHVAADPILISCPQLSTARTLCRRWAHGGGCCWSCWCRSGCTAQPVQASPLLRHQGWSAAAACMQYPVLSMQVPVLHAGLFIV